MLGRWLRQRSAKAAPPPGPRTMAAFFADAAREIDELIAADRDWYRKLPYQGGLSTQAARDLEIEKRAVWRRVIHEARVRQLAGLVWTTRQDRLVCPECAARHDHFFDQGRLAELEAVRPHLGCRCELSPRHE